MHKDQIDNLIINSNYDDDIKNIMFKMNNIKKEVINELLFKVGFRDYILDYNLNEPYRTKQKFTMIYNRSGRKNEILESILNELDDVIKKAHRSAKSVNKNHLTNFNKMFKCN